MNDSRLSALESEDQAIELNDNLAAYIKLLNERPQFKTSEGYIVDFYLKDPILDIGYIISNPLWIINSINYSPYGFINIKKEHQSIVNNNKFCGFIYKNNFYLVIYDQNQINLYSCNNLNTSNNRVNSINNLVFNFVMNTNNENIINIQFLPNDLGKAYFIVVTDMYNSYLLNISIENNNFNFIFEKCNDKYSQSILAKSFSSLWPFNSLISSNINNNISNCFIISPHRQLKKNNNLYTYYNTLFLLSNNSLILKKISFYINNNSINSQIENTKELSKEILTHFNSISKNVGTTSNPLNIISTDSYFNEKIKTLLIYCFIEFNEQKYILRIIVDNNFNISFDSLDVNQMITNPNVNRAKIFVNNYSDEGILVIPNDIIINFNYCDDSNKKNRKGWKSYVHFKKNILGINKFNQISLFNLDLFTLEEGIINFNPCLYYSSPNDIHGSYKIEQADHTNLFLSNFLQGQMLPYINTNSTSNQLFNSVYRLNSSNSININNGDNLNNSFQSQRALKPYEIILNNEKKKEFHIFLDEIIKKYMQEDSYLNKINEKDEYIISKLEQFFNNKQINNKNEALNDFLNYINNIINNDSTHIEIIEKSRTKAKLLTVEYLQEKYNKLMILYEILKKCKIDGMKIFDYYPDLLNEFFKIFEKIIIGINMRKQENIHLEKIEQGNIEEEKFNTLFLERFYTQIKNKLGNNKNFNHLLLFGKISNINEQLLDTFFSEFNKIFMDKNNNNSYNYYNDEEFYYQQKDNLLLFLINIIVGINEDIQKLITKLNQDGNNNKNSFAKYNNGLWYLSNNNYICTNYLLKIFILINKWKTEIFKDSKIDAETIFLLAEQLHFLLKNYLLIGNTSLKDKKDYINNQSIINSIMLNFNVDKAYYLSKKYYDHYTMAKIAFNNKKKYYNDLKEFMKNVLSKKPGHIKYILQIILEFEIQSIRNCKDNNTIFFNYFEDFDIFQKEIKEIIKNSKKLQNFFNLYLLKKNIETNINDNLGHDIVKNIVSNMKNNDIIDFNENKIKIYNLIKIVCLDKALNLIKYVYLNNNGNEDINVNNNINKHIENIKEDNIIYEILQLCNDKNYKNILNNEEENPQRHFYERTVQFLKDYFNNYILPIDNPKEVKENCYIIIFLLNQLIRNNIIQYDSQKEFIGQICRKCIMLDNESVYNKYNNYDEQEEENPNQKINLIYRITAENSIIIKLAKCFKNFNHVFLNKINEIKEDELNKDEDNRILNLLEFTNVLNNLIKPENMDKMEEEEEEIVT